MKKLDEWVSDYPAAWIQSGPEADHLDWVKDFGKTLADEEMSPTSFRNIFNEAKRLQSMPYETARTEFLLLNAKMAYAKGRFMKDENGKDAKKAEKAKKDNLSGIHKFVAVMMAAHREALNAPSKAKMDRYVDFMEAVLAYHKIYSYSEKLTYSNQNTNHHD